MEWALPEQFSYGLVSSIIDYPRETCDEADFRPGKFKSSLFISLTISVCFDFFGLELQNTLDLE